MLQIEGFEKMFTKYFQKNIVLRIGNDDIKNGKFLLIQNHVITNNFYFELVIENTKKIVSFKIPYPFSYSEYPESDIIYLDYRFNTLTKNPVLKNLMTNIGNASIIDKPSKFLDSILEIQFT